MTIEIFPALDGIEIGISKRPEFKTGVFEAVSGYESRIKFRAYPKYTFKLSLEFLIKNQDEDQLSLLMGFMANRAGMFDSFLFFDTSDGTVVNQPIGIGTGAATQFQLVRTYGGFTEPVWALTEYNSATLTVNYINKVFNVDYTINTTTGIVTFATAPPPGHLVTWSGSYYYQCRFLADGYDFTQLLNDLYDCREIEFVGSTRPPL
jgi:uncharacterized protein (TIGR02217 family)